MSISNKIDYDEILDAGAIRRFFAIFVDVFIVLLIRAVSAQVLFSLWIGKRLEVLSKDYVDFFNSDIIKNDENLNFIISHEVFSDFIIFLSLILLIGSLYYAFFHSSKYHATLGKRIMSIEILNQDYSKVSFIKALLVYYVSLTPFFYAAYLFSYVYQNKVGMITAMFSSYNTIFTICIILLSATYSFGFRRQIGLDIFAKVVLLNNKSDAKFPWER